MASAVRLCMIIFWVVLFIAFLFIPLMLTWRSETKELNVLVMPNLINADYLDAFEKAHHIKVNLSYAESNEEVVMKMQATHGLGYDLIMVSDYAIPPLIKDGLIQKIDKKKLPFFKDFYPALLNHVFDRDNEYSVPYYWGVYGFGIDKNYFKNKHSFDWSDLFDVQHMPYFVGMRESPRELILIAAFYLFGRIDHLGDEEYDAIKRLLIAQKTHVVMYADERINNLLVSQECPLILTISGDIAHTVRRYETIDFVLPTSGGFVDIDSFVIPIASHHVEEAHAFLTYIYDVSILKKYIKLFDFFSPLQTVKVHPTLAKLAIPTPEMFERLLFFDAQLSPDIIDDITIALKTAP